MTRRLVGRRLSCAAADRESSSRSDTNSTQPAIESSPLRAIPGPLPAAAVPTPLRGVAADLHNVALCKPPRCHGACETASSPRAGAGTHRASASLRITHIHVNGRQALRAGHRGPTHPRRPRAHPCARSFGCSPRCAWIIAVASARASPRACTRAAHAYTAACALRAHASPPACTHPRARRLNRCAVQAERASWLHAKQSPQLKKNAPPGQPMKQ